LRYQEGGKGPARASREEEEGGGGGKEREDGVGVE